MWSCLILVFLGLASKNLVSLVVIFSWSWESSVILLLPCEYVVIFHRRCLIIVILDLCRYKNLNILCWFSKNFAVFRWYWKILAILSLANKSFVVFSLASRNMLSSACLEDHPHSPRVLKISYHLHLVLQELCHSQFCMLEPCHSIWSWESFVKLKWFSKIFVNPSRSSLMLVIFYGLFIIHVWSC